MEKHYSEGPLWWWSSGKHAPMIWIQITPKSKVFFVKMLCEKNKNKKWRPGWRIKKTLRGLLWLTQSLAFRTGTIESIFFVIFGILGSEEKSNEHWVIIVMTTWISRKQKYNQSGVHTQRCKRRKWQIQKSMQMLGQIQTYYWASRVWTSR